MEKKEAFEVFDAVLIKEKNIKGWIVEEYTREDGQKEYTVQSENAGENTDPDAYFGLYDVTADRLEKTEIK